MGLVAGFRDQPVSASDFAIGVGWGGTATFTVTAGSSLESGEIVITASATTPAQATATIAFTLPVTLTNPARFLVSSNTTQALTEPGPWAQAFSNGVSTWTYGVLPVATKVYSVRYLLLNR